MGSAFISDTYVNEYYQAAADLKGKSGLKVRSQEWLSQSRGKDSSVVEILTYDFATRSPLSAISFDIYSVGAHYEFWYYDSDGTRLPLIRDDYNQIVFETESKEDWTKWIHWQFELIPCVATKLEIRMNRIADKLAPSNEYSLGLRKLAIKRQINARKDAALPLKPAKDILGNTVSKTVKDWQPEAMIDNNDYTFWKCEPQIAQDAVVCLYVDMRDKYGQAQYFDSIDLDPVYSGSQMNVYYSNDDAVGDRDVPLNAYDMTATDTEWIADTKTDQNAQGSWHMLKPTSAIDFDTAKADFKLDGSWMVAFSWHPVMPFSSNSQIVFSIGKNFYIKQIADQDGNGHFEFWYNDIDGMKHVDLDFPVPIEYHRGLPSEKNRDTEIRIEYGIERSAEEVLRARTRFIVKNWNTSEVLSDNTSEIALRTSTEISAIADAIPKDFKLRDDSEQVNLLTNPTLINGGTEIRIPSHSIYDVPLKDLSAFQTLTSANDKFTAEVMLKYRTEADFTIPGRLSITDGEQEEQASWWVLQENRSPSKLSVLGSKALTNWFVNPNFSKNGSWQPDIIDGPGIAEINGSNRLIVAEKARVRDNASSGFKLQNKTMYVFVATPEFENLEAWWKDCSLFIYDGVKDEFLETYSDPVESGKQVVLQFYAPDDSSKLSFGFSCGADGERVTWSHAGIFSMRDWEKMQYAKIDWFDGQSHVSDMAVIVRHNEELNLNPLNDMSKPQLGEVRKPTVIKNSAFTVRPFDGEIAFLSPGINQYDKDIDSWIWCKGASSLTFDFYVKSVNGFPDIQPVIIDMIGNVFYPDRFKQTESENGWWRVFSRVTVPKDHEAEYMRIGLYERNTDSHTYYGELHVYNNEDAFEPYQDYLTVRLEKVFNYKLTPEVAEKLTVRIMNMSDTFMYVFACNIKAIAADIRDIADSSATIASVQGTLESFVLKQETMPADIAKDKYLLNSDLYVSPDSYDQESTLSNAIVYGRFKEEAVLRGGITDSVYEAKTWYPLLTGQKLTKGSYKSSLPVQAKFIKLEFTQLTAVQYPIESVGISSSYRVFPSDITAEMLSRMEVNKSTRNSKQSVSNGYGTGLTDAQKMYYQSLDADNPSSAYIAKQSLYRQGMDVEVSNIKNPTGYIPDSGADPVDAQVLEYTSSVAFNGNLPSYDRTSRSKVDLLSQMNAQYRAYSAQASESLIALSNEYGIEDWKPSFDDSAYVEDTSDKSASSGRIPGYWVFPGQQQTYSNYNLQQIISNSKVDIVQKTSALTPITTIADTRTTKPSLTVVGQKFFAQPQVHYYETRHATRTQSIAYFVGIRELHVKIIDYLQQKDNVTWAFYSLGSSPWHLNSGYMTTANIFIPDLSTGAEKAVAETDVMHSQSYYRTVKLLSVNRDSLANRTYLDFNGELQKTQDYWTKYPALDCKWDDSTPDNEDVKDDNGGAWDSNRFVWADTQTGTLVSTKAWNVWYDGELVNHIVVKPEERVFDGAGRQQPYRYKLGELTIPVNSMVTIGTALQSLKLANPTNPNQHLETRLQIVSGQWANVFMMDEEVGFDDTALNSWQTMVSSRQRLLDTTYTCEVWVYFNHFEQLDIYLKAPYVETGTMRVLMKNNEKADWEDVTFAVGRTDSEYTFKDVGRDMQIRVEEYDPQDWFGQLIVIPLYIPQEDAIKRSDTITKDDGVIPISDKEWKDYSRHAHSI